MDMMVPEYMDVSFIGVEPGMPGEPLALGPYRVRPFQLVKTGPAFQDMNKGR